MAFFVNYVVPQIRISRINPFRQVGVSASLAVSNADVKDAPSEILIFLSGSAIIFETFKNNINILQICRTAKSFLVFDWFLKKNGLMAFYFFSSLNKVHIV